MEIEKILENPKEEKIEGKDYIKIRIKGSEIIKSNLFDLFNNKIPIIRIIDKKEKFGFLIRIEDKTKIPYYLYYLQFDDEYLRIDNISNLYFYLYYERKIPANVGDYILFKYEDLKIIGKITGFKYVSIKDLPDKYFLEIYKKVLSTIRERPKELEKHLLDKIQEIKELALKGLISEKEKVMEIKRIFSIPFAIMFKVKFLLQDTLTSKFLYDYEVIEFYLKDEINKLPDALQKDIEKLNLEIEKYKKEKIENKMKEIKNTIDRISKIKLEGFGEEEL
ncbi:MAG: hypothetical protein QXO40_00270 [Candidatus Aenigmatarchaeota archaeon]